MSDRLSSAVRSVVTEQYQRFFGHVDLVSPRWLVLLAQGTRNGAGERDEAADDRAVSDVGRDRGNRRPTAVVAQHETGWLEQRLISRRAEARAHPRMDDREQDVDQRGAGEQTVDESEEAAQPPTVLVDRGEDREIHEREQQPRHEVHRVADGFRPCAIGRDKRAEQKRQVHARQAELTSGTERRRENERPREASGERAPDAHAFSAFCNETAALTNDRWTSAWGVLPRNAPDSWSISSAYSPTSLAEPISCSISSRASSACPARASASTSQNEQQMKAPSSPSKPSSPL